MSYRRPPSKRSQLHHEAGRDHQEEGIAIALEQAENSSQKYVLSLGRSRPHFTCLCILLAPLLYTCSISSSSYFGFSLSQSTRHLHSVPTSATTNFTIVTEDFTTTTETRNSLDLPLSADSDVQAKACVFPPTFPKDENGFSFLNSSNLCHHDDVSMRQWKIKPISSF